MDHFLKLKIVYKWEKYVQERSLWVWGLKYLDFKTSLKTGNRKLVRK